MKPGLQSSVVRDTNAERSVQGNWIVEVDLIE